MSSNISQVSLLQNSHPPIQQSQIKNNLHKAALKKLQKQIIEIGKTDPNRASYLSRKIVFSNLTRKSLEELKTLGLDISSISPNLGLLGGVDEPYWVNGPMMHLTGNNSDTKVYHIPKGMRYINYRPVKWELSEKGASCSVTYVTGESKSSIDALNKYRNKKELSAAIKAKGLGAFDVGLGAEGKRDVEIGKEGAYSEKHTHAAVVITGDTKRPWIGRARLHVEIEIQLEKILEKRTSRGSSVSLAPKSFPIAKPITIKPELTPVEVVNTTPSPVVKSSRSLEHKPPSKPSPKPTLHRQKSSFDAGILVEKACSLITKKLLSPDLSLTTEQSIELLTTCIRYGKHYAEKIAGKEAVIVIGNTGAGKSTFVNYLSGCEMLLKSPEDLDLEGCEDMIDDIVVVRSKKEGGPLDEIMPIGHTKQSKTFMPQIETSSSNTYCDCPGFLDNRGAEINIANAVNIRAALTQAKSVKVIILINYHSLKADRGRGLSDMLKICSNLFGSMDNLKSYQGSLVLGVTQIPLNMSLTRLKKWIVKDTLPIMETLSERLFIFDPLERPLKEGGWKREECLTNLEKLTPIKNPSKIFQTVLTDSDEKALQNIAEKMGQNIDKAVKEKKLAKAATSLKRLKELSIIAHITIERLLNATKTRLERHYRSTVDAFKGHCHFERFSSADQLLKDLTQALEYFSEELPIKVTELQDYYQAAENRYTIRVQKEKQHEQALKAAQGQIKELIELLEVQKQATQQQLNQQELRFKEMLEEMKASIAETNASYEQMKDTLKEEMEQKLQQKEQELELAKGLNQKEAQLEVSKERKKLETEYSERMEKIELEKQKILSDQKMAQEKQKQELAAQKAKLEKQVDQIEVQQTQKKQELEGTKIPEIAFGKKAWKTYFGDIGVEPALPKDIDKILQGPCSIWPGKRVQDTHLLVLIPSKVNGSPLTLDSLSELIQKPQKGGHSTKYRGYSSEVKKEHGNKGIKGSHWALMTRDVVPNSRAKSYEAQKELVASFAKKSRKPYRLPKVLEAAASMLMHYVKTGERLYTNEPLTYTRCEEKVYGGKYIVGIGGFAAGGLDVNRSNYDRQHIGVGALWEFPQ